MRSLVFITQKTVAPIWMANMGPAAKSTVVGIWLVLTTVFTAGVGIAAIVAQPVGFLLSIMLGASLIAGSLITWGAGCAFGRRFFE